MSTRKSSATPLMRGVYAALATPRSQNSAEADGAALLEYTDTIARTGVDGLVLFGSTGEFVHFDMAERTRIFSLAAKRARIPLVVNVSHSCLSGAMELAGNAIECGASGILLMPPYFYRYSDDQLFAFYQEFCRSLNHAIPVYLYNLPFFTNPISRELMKRLLLTGEFSGVKDSSGEWSLFETIQAAREELVFQNLVGNDRIYSRARAGTADGIVSGVAAAIPELIVALDRAIKAAQAERVSLLEKRLQEFLDCVDRFPATVAIKQAAAVRGWKLGNMAIPPGPDTQADLRDFCTWIEQWLPLVLAESAAS